jgi:U5 small nuclear ribonucleoprotein component
MRPDQFMKVLWGDYYYNRDTKKFMRETLGPFTKRAFVEFILEPMYKIISHTISHEKDQLMPILKQLGVYLKAEDFKLSVRNLLKRVCSLFFGPPTCFVDMAERHLPSPVEASKYYVSKFYTGIKFDQTTELIKNMHELNPSGHLVMNALKMYNSSDCKTFYTLCKVMAGTIKKGDRLKVLGEKYSPEDPEDMSIKVATNLYLHQGRYYMPVREAYPGNWILIEGIDQGIIKTATIVDGGLDVEDLRIFRPIRFTAPSFFKLAIEPLIPSDLPKMLDGLRKISKSYPGCQTKVEESGEHLIIGSGELYLDSIMHDLRLMYSEVEIKVSDPSVTFCETVIDTSSIKCTSTTPNKLNRMTMIAEPLDKGLDTDIELEHIDLDWTKDRISNFFKNEYKWDLLSSQSVWAFGPDSFGPNTLIDDSLPGETDKRALLELKDSFVQGFQWSCREGPLCEEPVRGVKYKILDAQIASEPMMRIPGQIIPTARRTCYSSFLMANPRILEPQLVTEIQCTADCLPAVYNVLNRRRGHLIQELAKPGSPLFTVKASVPALDSFGFETDLRSHTVGSAFNLSFFDCWTILPGDPLDRSIQLKVLEPAPTSHLAREVLVKLRKRKGLNEEVSVLNYFDDPNIIELLKRDEDYKKVI